MTMGVALWLIYVYIHKFVTGKVKQYNLDADTSCMPLQYEQKKSLTLLPHGLVN